MKEILKKLFDAKKDIAQKRLAKEGNNSFSNYHYFTPEQVAGLVQEACEKYNLFTKFDLIRDEYGVEGQLTIYDIESDDSITFIGATDIPNITATNIAQQIGGCMTYTERYLKQTAFGIFDNSLDFDTTENTKKLAEEKNIEKKVEKKVEKKSEVIEKPRFNKEQYEQLVKAKNTLTAYEHSADLIAEIEKKYRVSKEMKIKIADLRALAE